MRSRFRLIIFAMLAAALACVPYAAADDTLWVTPEESDRATSGQSRAPELCPNY